MTAIALVRDVPDSLSDALVLDGKRAVVDVALARRQHESYIEALTGAGYDVRRIPADEAHPDCVFVEDTAVIVGNTAVMTRSGAPSRRGEIEPVRKTLPTDLNFRWIQPPGTLDGGDVFGSGRRLYVGLSRRTNAAGIDQLEAAAGAEGLTTTRVAVHHALHLKSAAVPLDADTVLVTPNALDEAALSDLEIIYEAADERHRASALPLRNGTLLVTSAAPITMARIAEAGYSIVPIDVSELQAIDGGLTCLSIII